jgi:hypothetical protein
MRSAPLRASLRRKEKGSFLSLPSTLWAGAGAEKKQKLVSTLMVKVFQNSGNFGSYAILAIFWFIAVQPSDLC